MKHYNSDEFFDPTIQNTKADAIDKKVSLLYDFCILTKKKKNRDERETEVRDLLSHYATETQMTNALHDVLCGNKTLNTLLKQRMN